MNGLEAAKKRFSDSDAFALGQDALAALNEYRQTGKFPRVEHSCVVRPRVYSHQERLAYYRAHGLARCNDYPGGDAAFEADVLSGEYHDAGVSMSRLKREDEYIIARMQDGRFRYDEAFREFGLRQEVELAYIKNAAKNHLTVHFSYPYGDLAQFEKDVRSGVYVCRLLHRRLDEYEARDV